MRERFYTAKDIAKFLGKDDRHIRRLAVAEYWEYKEVKKNGAMEKRYPLSSLPLPIQAKISQAKSLDLTAPSSDSPMDKLTLSESDRRIAEARFTAIKLFDEFHKEIGGRKTKALHNFVENWHNIASADTLKIIPKFTVRTFQRWEEDLAKGGMTGLVSAYGNRKGSTKLPVQYHNIVLKAYLDNNQRSIGSIYGYIINKIAAEELGEDINSLALSDKKEELKKLFTERVLRTFIKNNTTKGLCMLARGHKAEIDKMTPYVTRERTKLVSNQIWVSDGHDANTFVLGENGKAVRPVVVAWMDEKSRMIMGWSVDITENTDLIIDSLCNAVEKHGIPKEVYVDNGKAYINKRTTDDQEKNIQEKRFTTYQMLGCNVRKARPYNAREKTIEPFWNNMDEDFSKWIRGYAGKNILSKPKKTDLEIKHNRLYTIEEYKMFLEWWFMKYNTDSHTGEGMNGQSPYKVWQSELDKPITEVDKDLLILLRLVYINDYRIIGAGGRVRARNFVYVAPELVAHIGEKVKVGIDPNNLDNAYIFFNDKLLCIAESEVKADYDSESPKTQKAFRQKSRNHGTIKKLKKQILEIQKTESALILEEKTKAMENSIKIESTKEKTFDRYDY